MTKQMKACLFCAVLLSSFAIAQTNYSNYSQQTSRLNALVKNYPQVAKYDRYKNTGGKMYGQTLGSGDPIKTCYCYCWWHRRQSYIRNRAGIGLQKIYYRK
jgi:hypothetical protein